MSKHYKHAKLLLGKNNNNANVILEGFINEIEKIKGNFFSYTETQNLGKLNIHNELLVSVYESYLKSLEIYFEN